MLYGAGVVACVEVAGVPAQGLRQSAMHIAIDLGLSEWTVEIRRANAMEKMQARSVAHLVTMHLTFSGKLWEAADDWLLIP